MKVWGKEINSCNECIYIRSSYGNGYGDFSASCLLKPEYLYKGCSNCWYDDTTSKIDKDCPFSKPITKEVIESFGIKQGLTWVKLHQRYDKEDYCIQITDKEYLIYKYIGEI